MDVPQFVRHEQCARDAIISVLVSEAKKHYTAGVELAGQLRLEEAIAEYDQAIYINSQLAIPYAHRALAHTLLGRDAAAEENVERAVKLGFDRSVLESEIEELKKQR